MKENHISFLLYAILALVSISYFPGVLLTTGYRIINVFIGGAMAWCIFWNRKMISTTIKERSLAYFYLGALIVLIVSWVYDVNIVGEFLHLPIALACFLAGYSKRDVSSKFTLRAQILFCFFALVMGFVTVFLSGGFVIQDQYIIALKNSSGAILGTASIILLSLIFRNQLNLLKYLYILVLLVILACLFTFRNRSTMVGVLVSLAIMVSKGAIQMKKNQLISFIVGSSIVGIVIFYIIDIPVEKYLFDSFFANKNTSDIDDVSSGRISMIKEGWKYVMSVDPIACNLTIKREMGCIDCFPISIYNSFGVWGIIYYAPAYLFLFHYVFRRIRKASYLNVYPYVCMLTLLISSFFEASWPFSPGTSIFASFFFCGIEDRRNVNANRGGRKFNHRVYPRFGNKARLQNQQYSK